MYLTAFFTENDAPKTGLSPVVTVRLVSDESLIIDEAAMTEVGNGFYKYLFAGYVYSNDYVILYDSVALTGSERYTYGANENYTDDIWATVSAIFLLKIIKNKKEVKKVGNVWRLYVYDDDNVTPILQKDLKDPSGINITDLSSGTLAAELLSVI